MFNGWRFFFLLSRFYRKVFGLVGAADAAAGCVVGARYEPVVSIALISMLRKPVTHVAVQCSAVTGNQTNRQKNE